MKSWLIEPRDPMIFRDGRPFGANPGARATSLSFPYPSTLAGATRTLAGRDQNGHFDKSQINTLLTKKIFGPLLVELGDDGRIADWFFPAPADALVLRQKSYNHMAGRVVPLAVLTTPTGTKTNLKDGLHLVGAVTSVNEKPHGNIPGFWRSSYFESWLTNPVLEEDAQFRTIGIPGLTRESRMHVSIKMETQAAADGALFQTAGLEFTTRHKQPEEEIILLDTTIRLALALRTDANVQAGLGLLGGERRVVHWSTKEDAFPVCPDEVRKGIRKHRHCRLILLTPALFANGYLPALDPQQTGGVKATVVAVAMNRYQTVSGWDYDKRQPKPTRRLAPTGTVYFLKLESVDGSDLD
ncbi:MAG: type III-B CRISPR module-associated protein Cmr3, partial [Caldilineaceae bacterium]